MFCYICGKLGLGEGSRTERFTMGVDEGSRGRGPKLRADIRRGGGVAKSIFEVGGPQLILRQKMMIL